MLVDRFGSSVDLVKRMQLGGDLEIMWLLFDQVKRVQEWNHNGMLCVQCKIMTNAVSGLSLWTSFKKTTSERCRLDMFGHPYIRALVRDYHLPSGVMDGMLFGRHP